MSDVLATVALVGTGVAIWIAVRRSKSRAYHAGFSSGEASVMARVGATVVVSQTQHGHGVTTGVDDDNDQFVARVLAGLDRGDVRGLAGGVEHISHGLPSGVPARDGDRADGVHRVTSVNRGGRGPGA